MAKKDMYSLYVVCIVAVVAVTGILVMVMPSLKVGEEEIAGEAYQKTVKATPFSEIFEHVTNYRKMSYPDTTIDDIYNLICRSDVVRGDLTSYVTLAKKRPELVKTFYTECSKKNKNTRNRIQKTIDEVYNSFSTDEKKEVAYGIVLTDTVTSFVYGISMDVLKTISLPIDPSLIAKKADDIIQKGVGSGGGGFSMPSPITQQTKQQSLGPKSSFMACLKNAAGVGMSKQLGAVKGVKGGAATPSEPGTKTDKTGKPVPGEHGVIGSGGYDKIFGGGLDPSKACGYAKACGYGAAVCQHSSTEWKAIAKDLWKQSNDLSNKAYKLEKQSMTALQNGDEGQFEELKENSEINMQKAEDTAQQAQEAEENAQAIEQAKAEEKEKEKEQAEKEKAEAEPSATGDTAGGGGGSSGGAGMSEEEGSCGGLESAFAMCNTGGGDDSAGCKTYKTAGGKNIDPPAGGNTATPCGYSGGPSMVTQKFMLWTDPVDFSSTQSIQMKTLVMMQNLGLG